MVNRVPIYELTILLSFLKVTYFIADFSKRACMCVCVCMCTSVFDVCMVRTYVRTRTLRPIIIKSQQQFRLIV